MSENNDNRQKLKEKKLEVQCLKTKHNVAVERNKILKEEVESLKKLLKEEKAAISGFQSQIASSTDEHLYISRSLPDVSNKRKRSHSLPGSPRLGRREIDVGVSPLALTGFNMLRRIKLDHDMYDVDACSEGSSNTDSAVDLTMCDHVRSAKDLHRDFSSTQGKYLSTDPGFLLSPSSAVSPARVYSCTDILTPYVEAKIMADKPSNTPSRDSQQSYSSPKSCISSNKPSLLSQASSYSSYTNTRQQMKKMP